MSEEWRICQRFPSYEVSSYGRVRRCKPGKTNSRVGYILKPSKLRHGYLSVELTDGIKPKRLTVHVLVAEAFLGPRPSPKHEVAHWDGDKTNNVPGNLRWATRSENNADKLRHGTAQRGERGTAAKLTEDNVREAIRLRESGLTLAEIAPRYSVTKECIWRATSGKTWRHMERVAR